MGLPQASPLLLICCDKQGSGVETATAWCTRCGIDFEGFTSDQTRFDLTPYSGVKGGVGLIILRCGQYPGSRSYDGTRRLALK